MSAWLWVAAALPLIYLAWKRMMRPFQVFKEAGIPYEPGVPIMGSFLRSTMSGLSMPDFLLELRDKFRNQKFFGIFNASGPTIVIQDPELIKQITVKEFDHFVNHPNVFTAEADSEDLLTNSLSILRDQKWRDMRATLSPAFTGSKMRLMFDLVQECADDFVTYCRTNGKDGVMQISAKDIFSKVTTNIISTTAFGLKVDSVRDKDNPIYVNATKSFDIKSTKAQLKFFFIASMPKLARLLGVNFVPKESNEFFRKVVKDTIEHRRKANITRPDVIQLLMQAMDGKLSHDPQEKEESSEAAVVEESDVGKTTGKTTWSEVEIAAQCFLFFIAGFDTSSNLLTFAAYELAVNADAQEKLHAEIQATKQKLAGAPLTYEVIQKMEYLDAFVSETLRKHPPGFIMDRHCNTDTVIEDENGKKFTIPKGFQVWINAMGMHYTHKYFPNPQKFDPERFIGENRDKIQPNTFIPFGVGPRACIGSRFALMEVKVILYTVLSAFTFEACDDTMVPVRYAKGFSMQPSRDMIVDLKER